MKKLTNILKIGTLILFVGILAACNKEDEVDPHAYLQTEIENYAVKSIYNDEVRYTKEGEADLIKIWLDSMSVNNAVIDTTSTGLRYIVEKIGTGNNVKTGDQVTVKYIGFFMNGNIFDASAYRGDGTYNYKHKTDPLIKGWEEGIEVLKKGGRAAFLIPSAKGYGSAGNSSIPPNTPLIFIIEVVDIK